MALRGKDPLDKGHSITNVRFSNGHRAKKANRGQISQVMPRTSSRESSGAYSQRVNRRGLTTQAVQKSRVKAIIIAALIVVVAIVAAVITWNLTYRASIASKMALNDDAAVSKLTAPANATDPYYILIAAELDTSKSDYPGPGMLTLVRVNADTHHLTLINIPTNIEVTLSDGAYHDLSYAQVVGGDAELISKVSTLTGTPIAHYMKTNAADFVSLIDALGGLDVTLPVEVDDPSAGDVYLPAGQQHLDGASALVACRGANYTDPVEGRANAQAQVMFSMLAAVCQTDGVKQAASLDSISAYFKTDMSVDTINGLMKAFSNAQDNTLYSTKIPGSTSVETDGTYWSVSKSSWENLKSVIDSDGDPNQKGAQSSVNPADVSVTVKNGAGIAGAASQMSAMLSERGYKVEGQGNADSYVYDQTLVVYKDTALKDVADEVVAVIGSGRSVEASYHYTFDTDLLVIIGKDWKPQS